jgi:hypothetical protein
MIGGDDLDDLKRLVAIQAIQDLKGRRDHAVDRKDWDLYASLHSDQYVAVSIGPDPVVGGRAAADALAKLLAGVTTIHHSHTPVIEFQDRNHATGVWAMEDNLFWSRDGQKEWLRGFGFYFERYIRETDGQWRFSYRRLERTHAETSLGASSLAVNQSSENKLFGAA